MTEQIALLLIFLAALIGGIILGSRPSSQR